MQITIQTIHGESLQGELVELEDKDIIGLGHAVNWIGLREVLDDPDRVIVTYFIRREDIRSYARYE